MHGAVGPPQLQRKNSRGDIVGCMSACLANLDGNAADSVRRTPPSCNLCYIDAGQPNCCSGSHNTPATCPVSGVQFLEYFRESVIVQVRGTHGFPGQGCPDAYLFAYDDGQWGSIEHCYHRQYRTQRTRCCHAPPSQAIS